LALLAPEGFDAAPESPVFASFDDAAGAAASPDPEAPPWLAPLELLDEERESVL
jgi:hypothetical protein